MLSVKIKKRLGTLSTANNAIQELHPAAGGEGGSAAYPVELDVDFVVPAGVTILFGPSGAGKTTLLRCIAGIVSPDSGSIVINESILFDSERQINMPIRGRGVGYVFQNQALFPHLTALANVEFGMNGGSRRQRRQRAASLMKALRIEHTADRRPAQISGGEGQRVALARALAVHPRLLLLDEPLSAIDDATKVGIISDLKELNRQLRLPVLYVTHSRDEAITLGQRILVMEHGRIIAAGEPLEVFGAPASKSVARLTGVENIFEGVIKGQNPDAGTASVIVTDDRGSCEIGVPSSDRRPGETVTVAVRSGDILLATSELRNTSARNILLGKISGIERGGDRVLVTVASGVKWKVSVTREAAIELGLAEEQRVWIAFKSYSCHILDK